jgi:hypothetical protein
MIFSFLLPETQYIVSDCGSGYIMSDPTAKARRKILKNKTNTYV